MPRKKTSINTQTSIRLDDKLLADADALIPLVSDRIGAVATRADVIRVAIVRGLKELTKEAAKA